MQTVYDVYKSADAANEVCGLLEFNGYQVFVKPVGDVFEVIIVD